MKTYLINLDKRQDRIEECLYANIPFPFERFSATDGDVFINEEENKFMRGHFGCWDSHRRLLEKLRYSSDDYTLILEDDVQFVDGLSINDIMEELPFDWDLLYLGGLNKGKVEKYSEHLNVATEIWQTHAYIVRKKFIPVLLEQLNSYRWKVDIVFSEALVKGNCFISNPPIAIQRESYSDITKR